ncbi:hypothetical protein M378DRAFT_52534, partial [Amanita muscaria Koide BX008]
MEYRHRKTVEISNKLIETNGVVPVFGDVFHGSEYLEVVRAGNINEHDTAILFSLDGAQLYRSKESDCWFFVWIVLNLAPELRYKKKHILPVGFVPGPNKPDNIESFILPSFRHLSALQKDGLMIWHGGLQKTIKTRPFFMYATADTLALPIISGLVGHSGSHGCRLYCGFRSRNKPRHPTYYPAALKPDISDPQYKCGFPDFDMQMLGSPDPSMYYRNLCKVLQSSTQAAYNRVRLETGIVRPSLCLGLDRNSTLPVPSCFPLDLMHLASLNIPQHLIEIWRGSVDGLRNGDHEFVVLKDDAIWQEHGALVASMRCYLPDSFSRPPRNPAEKINTQYKATEFL